MSIPNSFRTKAILEIQDVLYGALVSKQISHMDYSDRTANLEANTLPLGRLYRIKDSLEQEFS